MKTSLNFFKAHNYYCVVATILTNNSQIVTSYMTEYSLNLSILLSEGKETNRDFISSGERTWNIVQDLKSRVP
jgi:hypothetical protein